MEWNILNMDESNFFKFHPVAFSPCLNELCIVSNPQEPSDLVPDPFSLHSKKLKVMYSNLGRPMTIEVTCLHPYHWHSLNVLRTSFPAAFPHELCLNRKKLVLTVFSNVSQYRRCMSICPFLQYCCRTHQIDKHNLPVPLTIKLKLL